MRRDAKNANIMNQDKFEESAKSGGSICNRGGEAPKYSKRSDRK
jgi:hypothetical protein